MVSRFFPKYLGEYFLKFGEIYLNIADKFQAAMWNIPLTYFREYFPKIGNFPKLLCNFRPYILGNTSYNLGKFSTIFWGLFPKHWKFTETILEFSPKYFREYFIQNGEISPNIFHGIFHTNLGLFRIICWGIISQKLWIFQTIVKLFTIYFGEYFPNIGNSPELLWNFPQHISGNISYKMRNFPKLLWNFLPYILWNF